MNSSGDPITITPLPQAGSYEVAVAAERPSRHRVSVSPDYLRELGLESAPTEAVVKAAFAFLLEREPNTSILATFDLHVIERYFPEFRREIARRIHR